MSKLDSLVKGLAASFAKAVVDAVRTGAAAALVERREVEGGSVGPRSVAKRSGQKAPTPRPAQSVRRSPEDIAQALARVVAYVREHPEGRRAEHIREALGMERNEMPRVLKTGLATRQLRATGSKRSTTYFVAQPAARGRSNARSTKDKTSASRAK